MKQVESEVSGYLHKTFLWFIILVRITYTRTKKRIIWYPL